MTILIVSTSYPKPADVGRKVVMSGFLSWLGERRADTRVAYLHLAPRRSHERRDRLPVELYESPVDPAWRRLGSMAVDGLLRGRQPLQVVAVSATRATGALREAVARLSPSLVIADTLRVVPALARLDLGSARRVLNLDDLYSRRYARTLEALRQFPDADLDTLGTFARFLPPWLARAGRTPAAQKMLLQREMRLMEQAERAAPAAFDRCLLLNTGEAELLRQWTGATNIASVPPYVGIGDLDPVRRPADPPRFLFLGNLSYPANSYGLRRFLREAMPPLLAERPDAGLDVVGAGADADLEAEVARFGGRVRLLGYVPDLDRAFAEATALVAPLMFGTGVKIKIVDALARGVPVVTTPTGIEGIEMSDGREGYVREDLADFVAPLLSLTEPAANARFSEAAHRLYRERYSKTAAFAAYEEAF
jgi:glycosyltransferase involved in cell wall biosynthesis